MIRSMTGFGKGQARGNGGTVTVELKTVNHKFFDATLKLPNNLGIFEDRIKEVLQKKVLRGKVNLTLTCDRALLRDESPTIDVETARGYYRQLAALRKKLGIADTVGLKEIVTLPGVVNYEAREECLTRVWPAIKKAIDGALERLVADREREGRGLYADLSGRAKTIKKMLGTITSRAHLHLEEYRRKFAERVKDLTGGREIDRGRLEMEVAIFAKNCDITEEITRLENHLDNFIAVIAGAGDIGKKLDFIAQELHREINTIGSKASDFRISKSVIEIKGEIEKIREQAKNVE